MLIFMIVDFCEYYYFSYPEAGTEPATSPAADHIQDGSSDVQTKIIELTLVS